MKRFTMVALSLGLSGLAACTESTGPGTVTGNASAREREEILAAIEAAQFFGETFDLNGMASDFLAAAPVGAGPQSTVALEVVPLPRHWGRRWGQPIERTRTINVTNDTARVELAVRFEGQLLALLPRDGAPPDTLRQPFRQTFLQRAVLVRATHQAGERRWRLVGASPAQFVMTDVARRTTSVTRVTVEVNGQVKIDVTDPGAIYDVDAGLPRLEVGDQVRVTARVSNTAGTGNTPETFVFLHIMHARDAGLGWARIPMDVNPAGDYVRSWTVRHPGRERIGVDAIDSQSFQAGADKEYRSNAWGIPYRIGSGH